MNGKAILWMSFGTNGDGEGMEIQFVSQNQRRRERRSH